MPFLELYQHCQHLTIPVSRKHIKAKAFALAGVTVRHGYRDTVPGGMRGYFVDADPSSPLAANIGTHFIITQRDLPKPWQRFIYTKELMHLFDTLEERITSGEILERVLNEFQGAEDACVQSHSETKGFWMALMLLCPEEKRQEYIQMKRDNQIDDYGIASALDIPEQIARHLTGNLYEVKRAEILEECAAKSIKVVASADPPKKK